MDDYVSDSISEALSEYLIKTAWIVERPENVSLEVQFGPISLQYPYMTARMQCVVGPEMAVAAGRNGILTMIPRSLPDEEKQKILKANKEAKVKKDEVQLVERPEFANPDSTLETVVNTVIRTTGHSVIPILDRQRLLGVYIHNPNNPPQVPDWTPISDSKLMLPLVSPSSENKNGVVYLDNSDPENIRRVLLQQERKFLPIVDDNMIFQKLAFLQKFDTNFIGMAINTRGDWKSEINRWAEQVDTLCTDSSNACFDDAKKILQYVKESKVLKDKLFGIGNIISGKDYRIFAEAGADYLIAGMGVGSICKTGSKRGNGRGQMTVALEIARERDKYFKQTGRYVPLVLDGSIETIHERSVALTMGDLVMMGNYFNRFYEAAAGKFKENKKEPAYDEGGMGWVETWGEGHPHARKVAMCGIDLRRGHAEGGVNGENVVSRYGHSSVSAATVEGVLGFVKYRGRLKPCVEEDAGYIRTTISNVGGRDLKTYRDNVRDFKLLERASARTMGDMLPHDLEIAAEE